MNGQECDILCLLAREPFVNQRILAETSGHSLGIVNRSLKNLIKAGYLDEEMQLTDKAKEKLQEKSPKRAVILAAGFGMRMVPIHQEVPKALLEVKGELLIERQIRQLQEAGITEIYVVVGFRKERFEYLIDEYGVRLVVNPDYALKNNLHSLKLVLGQISNAYIVPCDIWSEQNPFRRYELYSWYMVSDRADTGSEIRVNRKMELVKAAGHPGDNKMVGIAYFVGEDAAAIRKNVEKLCADPRYDGEFWETALYEGNKMIVRARIVGADGMAEINTYEQLRELDNDSSHLKSEELNVISKALKVPLEGITDISVVKKGMTNRSFFFQVKGETYIMRIPGEGTENLINRKQEAEVYRAIAGQGLCDDPVYLDPNSGYKITRFLKGVRPCDPNSLEDITACMKKLRAFHAKKFQVGHEFQLFEQIEFYESLWAGKASVYKDYESTKEQVFSLRTFIEEQAAERCLTHIDAVPDNFLFYDKNGTEELQLTDWEYAGMQDPHVDIAMFCIYALYEKWQADRLIDLYFDNLCTEKTRVKIYCYIAVCGLLWSNWCEYKSTLGIEFGEYSLRQYRYAKEYYRYVQEQMQREGQDVPG